jgi:hypothetical protein
MGAPSEGHEDAPETSWRARSRMATFSVLCGLVVVKLCLDIVVEAVYLRQLHVTAAHAHLEALTL